MLLAAGVHVPSGARTHGIDDLVDPDSRSADGEDSRSASARGSWIGSAAVVMADVGRDAVVAAGAVVTRPIPDRTIAGGVPARVLRHRDPQARRAPGLIVRVLVLTHRLPYAPNRGDRLRAYHMLRGLATRAEVELVSLVHDEDEAAHVDEVRAFVPHVTALARAEGAKLCRCRDQALLENAADARLLDAPDMVAYAA